MTNRTSKGYATVLVVEDEELVMEVEAAMIERIGYRVLQARTGAEAVEIARTYEGDIDLALLDVTLPDMNGDQVYPLIMDARPGQKVVVCSGLLADGPAKVILDAGADGFMQKPFDLKDLQRKLEEILDR